MEKNQILLKVIKLMVNYIKFLDYLIIIINQLNFLILQNFLLE